MACPVVAPLWRELQQPAGCWHDDAKTICSPAAASSSARIGASGSSTWDGVVTAVYVNGDLPFSAPAAAWALLAFAAVLEVLFFFLLRCRARQWRHPLDQGVGQFPPATRPPAEALLRKIEAHMCISRQSAEDLLTGWYFDADMGSLSRAEGEGFLAWAVFARRRDELSPQQQAMVRGTLDRVEVRTGLNWGRPEKGPSPGHRASAQRFAAHTWEPVCAYRHLPLFVYTIILTLQCLVDPVVLRLMGFRRGCRGGVSYWIRPGLRREPKASGRDAFVFLHGILVARMFYLHFLLNFRNDTLLLVDMPWVAFNPLRSTAPQLEDFCEGVADVLDTHGLRSVSVSAHSYGSFVAAWLLFTPRLEQRIARLVLMSAPALCLFLPKTCRSVVYDKPFWFEHGLAHVFFRQFFWYQNVLTAEDLPRGSVVVLSENDEMIPVPDVVRDCQEHGISCLVLPGMRHGFELFQPLSCHRIARFVLEEAEGRSAPKKEGSPSNRLMGG